MRIFVMLSRVPYPLEKGDKLRAFHQIRQLAKKHEIILCCVSDEKVSEKSIQELKKICTHLEIFKLNPFLIKWNLFTGLFSIKPFQVKYFYQSGIKRKIDALIEKHQPDHIYCQLIRATEYVKNQHAIPKTIDYMDAFSKGMERRINTSSFIVKPLIRTEMKRLLGYEHLVFEYFEHKSIISKQDQELIYHPQRKEIQVIPNGVDTDYFVPRERDKTVDLVFVGNMGYAPNIDTAHYLAKEVMPLIWKERPETTLCLAGASPHPSVKALENERIQVSGWVKDIRDSYASARVFLAPMQIGTGLQNKLLEAMAMEIPCITSALANNALQGKHNEHLLVGHTVEDFKTHVLTLLNDAQKADQIASNGLAFVQRNFNWVATTTLLEKCITKQTST